MSERTDPTPRDPYECPECGFSASAERLKARAEGRQQAVRQIRERLRRTKWYAEDAVLDPRDVERILDDVARHDPAPKPGCIYRHPHPDHECRNQDDMRADPAGEPNAILTALAEEGQAAGEPHCTCQRQPPIYPHKDFCQLVRAAGEEKR